MPRALLESLDPRGTVGRAYKDREDRLDAIFCAYLAALLRPLGYFDQAREHGRQALAAAEKRGEPFALAGALILLIGPLLVSNPDDPVARTYLGILAGQVVAARLAMVRDWIRLFRGFVRVVGGEVEAGLDLMHEGLAGLQTTGPGLGRPMQLVLLAQAYGRAGQAEALVGDGLGQRVLRPLGQTEKLLAEPQPGRIVRFPVRVGGHGRQAGPHLLLLPNLD
jgi:hypothetical protein